MRAARLVVTVAGLLAAVPVRADEAGPPSRSRDETVITGDIESGGYGAPRVSFGRTAGHDSVLVGAEGGWIVEHHFILGAGVYTLATDQPAPAAFADTHNLIMAYGGLLIGSSILPHRLIHPTFTVLIGGGGLGMRSRQGDGTTSLGDAFFILEPSATLDLNITTFFHLAAGVSYRWVRSVDTPGLSNADLTGVLGSVLLKFGKF